MAASNPQITFLVPLRVFVEDKSFLSKNLINWIWKQVGHSDSTVEQLEGVFAYRIILAYQSYKPVDIPFTKAKCQIALKAIFPNAKCLGVDIEYTQHKSKTMLPLIDFQIYFK